MPHSIENFKITDIFHQHSQIHVKYNIIEHFQKKHELLYSVLYIIIITTTTPHVKVSPIMFNFFYN